jgi:hypothetical protein
MTVKISKLVLTLMSSMLISSCATTNTGQTGGMIVDAAKEGDVLGATLMTLVLPVSMMMDVVTLGNTLDADQVKSATNVAIAAAEIHTGQSAGSGATRAGQQSGYSGSNRAIFIPEFVTIPTTSGMIPADPALPNAVEGAQGLCSLVRFAGAQNTSFYSMGNWHMAYDPIRINHPSSEVQIVRKANGKVHWFRLHVASEDMDTHACVMKFKDSLNIYVGDNPRREYRSVVPRAVLGEMTKRYDLMDKGDGFWIFRGGQGDSTISKDFNNCNGGKVNGYNRDLMVGESSYQGTTGAYFGAPIFVYEDTLKYLYAYQKFFRQRSEKLTELLNGYGNTEAQERLRNSLLTKTEDEIKILECHKREGYPFARENAIAIVPARLDDKEHNGYSRFANINDVPYI